MQDVVASVTELWRYPVKGMRGEQVQSLELHADGVAGDRRFAIESSGAPRGKPLLSGRERAAMLLYAAQAQGSTTRVVMPHGPVYSIDDPALLAQMQQQLPGDHSLSVVRSSRPLTDVRPVALLGMETVDELAKELGRPVDVRRFRANLLLKTTEAFAEDALVGRELAIGTAVLRVTERTPRCRIVTLDPKTAEPDPALMKHLDRVHGGRLGVYAVVLRRGTLRTGDPVCAL